MRKELTNPMMPARSMARCPVISASSKIRATCAYSAAAVWSPAAAGAALAREAPFAATYRDAFQHTRSEEWMT
jgi:hypothetical protein